MWMFCFREADEVEGDTLGMGVFDPRWLKAGVRGSKILNLKGMSFMYVPLYQNHYSSSCWYYHFLHTL